MDRGIKAISSKRRFKIFLVDISDTLQEIVDLQQTNPLATIIIGRFTIGNALLSLNLKNNELFSATFFSKESYTGKIITEIQNNFLRSYIENPQFNIERFPSQLFENPLIFAMGTPGELTIIRRASNFEPYISKIVTGKEDIDKIFTNYGLISNQIHNFLVTRVVLDEAFKVQKAVGVYLELFPDYSEDDINYLASKMQHVQKIAEDLVASSDYQTFLTKISDDLVIIDERILKFQCTCNRKKTLAAAKLLLNSEIADLQENIEVVCDFCKHKYCLTAKELKSFSS